MSVSLPLRVEVLEVPEVSLRCLIAVAKLDTLQTSGKTVRCIITAEKMEPSWRTYLSILDTQVSYVKKSLDLVMFHSSGTVVPVNLIKRTLTKQCEIAFNITSVQIQSLYPLNFKTAIKLSELKKYNDFLLFLAQLHFPLSNRK